jgi:hypothetical protein
VSNESAANTLPPPDDVSNDVGALREGDEEDLRPVRLSQLEGC